MAKLEGMKEILDNLKKETDAITLNSEEGVLRGALFIMRKSKQLVPIRLGNLRNSAYIISNISSVEGGGGFKGDDASEMASVHEKEKMETRAEVKAMSSIGGGLKAAAVSYSAVYALSVHENPSAGIGGSTSQDDTARGGSTPLSKIHSKQGAWKFLEGPIKESVTQLLEIIRKAALID